MSNPDLPPLGSAPLDDARLRAFADRASDFKEPMPPPNPPSDGWYWRFVDAVGPYASLIATAFLLVPFAVALFGDLYQWSWTGFLVIPATFFFAVSLKYLVRKRQRAQTELYLLNRLSHEQARLDVARIVLEQSKQKPAEPEV